MNGTGDGFSRALRQVEVDEARNQMQNQACRAIRQLSWCPRSQHRAQHQTDVERADLNQQTLRMFFLP